MRKAENLKTIDWHHSEASRVDEWICRADPISIRFSNGEQNVAMLRCIDLDGIALVTSCDVAKDGMTG